MEDGDEGLRPAETGQDRTLPEVPELKREGWISTKEALPFFADAGVVRRERQIRRYCERGDIECVKLDSERHEKWLINPNSLPDWISQLLRAETDKQPKARAVMSGQDRTLPDTSGRDREEIIFLRDQVKKKDDQIDALLERDKETNILIHRLQDTVISLQPPLPDNKENPATPVYDIENKKVDSPDSDKLTDRV